MQGKSNTQKNSSWGFRKGPGILIWLSAGLVVITIVFWRSEGNWKWISGGLSFLVVILLAYFGEQVRCFLDVDRRVVFLRRIRIWKKSERVIPFEKIVNTAVESSSSGTRTRTHKVILALTSGERISLNAHPSSTKWTKDKLAHKIADTLNQSRDEPMIPALNGVVRVERQGETRGISWKINSITANNSAQITQWFSSAVQFDGGFLLLFPAIGSSNSGAVKLTKTSRFFYKQYLRTLMIEETQIPGFDDAVLLKKEDYSLGKKYSCISNKPANAVNWFTDSIIEKIKQWIPPQGKDSHQDLHLLATSEGVRLLFKKLYYQDTEIQQIADFGVSLIEDQVGSE